MNTAAPRIANDNRSENEMPAAAAVPQPVPPPPAPMSPARAAVYMASSLLLFLTQGLGMNLLNANIYQLQGSLSATTVEIAWLSAAYMAPYASMSIALFKIRSQYGLRRFAELSIVCFVFASILNIFVSDLHSAIVVRFISGMAAAPLSTLGFLYMLEAFPPARKLSVGLSLALMNTTLSAPLARIISPSLMDLGGWQALYTFEMGFALMALPVVYLLPLTAPPRAKVIQRMDILNYLLLAVGFGCLAVFLTLGRLYWWFEVPWLGVLLAVAIVALTLMVVLELPRKMPLIDLRWVFSKENMHVAGILLLFRVVSSEQTTTAANFYMQLGLLNDQTQTMYVIILLASIAGGLVCTVLMLTRYVETAHVLALMLIAGGAFLDSQSTSLTRPEQMYLSQAMVAAGAAMFLPPVMAKGFAAALARGTTFLVNFLVIFLFTQSLGSLLAQAALGTFVTIREKFHSNVLVEHILLTNPFVAQRVSQLSATYGKVITDKSLLNAEGLVLLGQQVTREANILAYNDTFLVISIAAAIGLVLLLGHLAWLRLIPHKTAAPAVAAQS
ncbi:MFS transporter [Pararhizobium polonicum]|uniref:MFS transporter n=1 Tax=Pararhizobium polonicum TaxID=1612624 RepID=A0A1C7P4C6_9HYPH|nr:MFS transporter [Pararhizobium polonicum]OBZ96135.1 MFS transporter [Pararhizobium polonicum]